MLIDGSIDELCTYVQVVYRNFWRWDDPKHQNMKYWPNMDAVPELAGISHQMIFLEVRLNVVTVIRTQKRVSFG
jgi:hypothetical protein